jgi:signal peptidase I
MAVWRDIWWFAAIIYLKFLVFDFRIKVPTGSMEPTLHGHPDYGDNVFVNRLAYVSAFWVAATLTGLVVLVVSGIASSQKLQREELAPAGILRRRFRLSLPVMALLLSALAWSCRNSVADEPQRFQIVTFDHESEWDDPSAAHNSISYVKRVVGLPGEKILISGGDLYRFDPAKQKNQIIRKWQADPDLQDSLWLPVAKAWPEFLYPQITARDRERIEFPWSGAEPGAPGILRQSRAVVLDGTTPVTLNYKYPVTNAFVKQGRWPFHHENCTAPNSAAATSYVANTCDGVQCPLCKRVMFPIALSAPGEPLLTPGLIEGGSFFAGGESIVGDLKLDLDLELEQNGGTLEIEVGSSLHRAAWTIPSVFAEDNAAVHRVQAATGELTAGHHRFSLAYVDATVIACMDGREVERRCIDVDSPGTAAGGITSVVRIAFDGIKGTLTRLDLSRDLYYTSAPKSFLHDPNTGISPRQHSLRYFENGEFVFNIPHDSYLMLGDNSPCSSDGRIWGFVPRRNLTGRALGIMWPPSRWQTLK